MREKKNLIRPVIVRNYSLKEEGRNWNSPCWKYASDQSADSPRPVHLNSTVVERREKKKSSWLSSRSRGSVFLCQFTKVNPPRSIGDLLLHAGRSGITASGNWAILRAVASRGSHRESLLSSCVIKGSQLHRYEALVTQRSTDSSWRG